MEMSSWKKKIHTLRASRLHTAPLLEIQSRKEHESKLVIWQVLGQFVCLF